MKSDIYEYMLIEVIYRKIRPVMRLTLMREGLGGKARLVDFNGLIVFSVFRRCRPYVMLCCSML